MSCRCWRTLLLLAVLATTGCLTGCLDVRDFQGSWQGRRVGDSPALKQGFSDTAAAALSIEDIDLRSFSARLTIDGLFQDAPVAPIDGAEADALSSMTFDGSPARVFMAFVETTDSGGDALVMLALYDDPRVVVRVLRGGPSPLYGVFSLSRGGAP
jgi:hypothetical protein